MLKNLPKLRLSDLLRRRKTNLAVFIEESGVQTYAALVNACEQLGVQSPSEDEYRAIKPTVVSSPSDGVIVLESLSDERVGKKKKKTSSIDD